MVDKVNSNILLQLYLDDNDAIGKFLKNSTLYKDKKPRFFFIHSMMPHAPFIYDKNCKLADNQKDLTLGYKMNYLCSLKKVKEFQDYIMLNDKNAVVVIQGDHGLFF